MSFAVPVSLMKSGMAPNDPAWHAIVFHIYDVRRTYSGGAPCPMSNDLFRIVGRVFDL
jgi:hypothetical protein